MERSQRAALSAFVVSLVLLSVSAQTSFAYDHPAQSATTTFLIAGVSLLLSSRFAPTYNHAEFQSFDAGVLPAKEDDKHRSSTADFVDKRWTWVILALGTCALALRVDIWRRLVQHSECATLAVGVFPPFLISLYDYWSSSHVGLGDTLRSRNIFNQFLPQALLVAAGLAISSWKDAWRSTVICPLVGNSSRDTFLIEVLSALLDAVILISFGKLRFSSLNGKNGKQYRTADLWAFVLLGTAASWVLAGLIHPFGIPAWKPAISSYYLASALKRSFLFTTLIVSASQVISQVGLLTLSFAISFAFTYVSLWSFAWDFYHLRIMSTPMCLLSILFIHAAAYFFLQQCASPHSDRKRKSAPSAYWRWLVLISFFNLLVLAFLRRADMSHPIDTLIAEAQGNHREWASNARRSNTLEEAVTEYQRRYNQYPPPGFDLWYEYATNRSSLIIDDFDQILQDLLPFRAMKPNHLRDLTVSLTRDPWNEVAALEIRNGVAKVQPEIMPTHRWMVEGIAQMVSPFAAHLPDMGIAFNLNDECRVAVPWEDIQTLKHTGEQQLLSTPDDLISRWSSNRASTWEASAQIRQSQKPKFVNLSFQKIFDRVARPLCSSWSNVRRKFPWDLRRLCVWCAQPHSRGQFVQDWDASLDICHQPDLAFLHGFFLSPASFKVSQTLLPVFSQSKVSGFNDILYPSSWNYIDKVKYDPSPDHPDPPYTQKEATLFWRGSTSEGSSTDGSWKGLTRQRLVHLANNHSTDALTVLLPSSPESNRYTYQILRGASDLNLNTSISIAGPNTRCAPNDCSAQTAELGTAARIDFQSHWAYRFLFDMDGAGFSGRFLPFLQSRSVPVRTALFRQWLDSRITPWLHFVPQDLRLHDVFSTLAYFAGAKTTTQTGTEVLMEPHDREGEFIAEEGRKWAESTLRKEDMEIYMFRLLLEWGRLTDDRRDELGFTI